MPRELWCQWSSMVRNNYFGTRIPFAAFWPMLAASDNQKRDQLKVTIGARDGRWATYRNFTGMPANSCRFEA
jgi:hypothetical protein